MYLFDGKFKQIDTIKQENTPIMGRKVANLDRFRTIIAGF